MVRVVLFLLVLAAIATGAAWLADQSGTVTVVWLGRHIEFEVLTGLVAVLVAAALAMALIALLRWLIASPRIAARAMRRRRRAKAEDVIARGIVAVGAGDRRTAERYAQEAARLAPEAPLTLLLTAQTAQIAGDRAAAEQAFRAMLERGDTRLLGLRGLYMEAQRRRDPAAARAIAEEAAKAAPSAGWASQAVLEYQGAGGDWDGALASVERQYAARVIDKETAKRHRAVLLTAKALEAEDRDPAAARAMALEANSLAPTLVPAAVVAGRLLAAEGDLKKASRILETAWKATPQPEIAVVYATARHGDSRTDQLKRVEYLARLTPSHPEALLAVARAAIDAGDFAAAHRAVDELMAGAPTQRACLIAAELAAKETNDHGRAREWMARALRAPRDPAWTADGQASDVWLPVSPVTGRLDAFEWKVPVAELGGPALHVDDVLADAAEPHLPLIEAEPAEPAVEAEPAAEAPAAEPEPVIAVPLPEAPQPLAAAEPKAPAAAPTVFPLAHAPDDPGPEREGGARKRLSFFG